MRPTWGFRVVRAAMFAATCVLLAALGHVLMSGTAIPWWTVAAAFAGIGLGAWAIAGRERGVPVVVLATVSAQAALHAGFSYAQALAHPLQTPPDPAAIDHSMHHAMPMAADGTHPQHAMTMPETAAPVAHQMTGTASLGMLIAHVLAALVCGLWLAYGERALFRIVRATVSRLLLPLRLILRPPVAPYRPGVRLDTFRTPFRRYLLVHSITSRGPPRGIAVA